MFHLPKSKLTTLLTVVAIFLGVPVGAQDGCTFYADRAQQGASIRFNMPDSALSGYGWSNYSRRFTGDDLNVTGSPIYRNLESVKIDSRGTDVSLYVYEGDHFDGTFQVLPCSKSQRQCRWDLGRLRNNVRSVICQRDSRIQGNTLMSLLSGFDKNSLVPSPLIADLLVATVHAGVKTQSRRFYNRNIEIRRGRMMWSTGHELCRVISCNPNEPEQWRRKYRDYLQFQYWGRGRLRADGRTYTMKVNLWILPMLENGRLKFAGTAWHVDVTNGTWSNKIETEIKKQVKRAFLGTENSPNLGDRLTFEFDQAMRQFLSREEVNGILDGNIQLIFSHPCIATFQRVGYPGHAYTPEQLERICAGNTNEAVASPGIRLLKRD